MARRVAGMPLGAIGRSRIQAEPPQGMAVAGIAGIPTGTE